LNITIYEYLLYNIFTTIHYKVILEGISYGIDFRYLWNRVKPSLLYTITSKIGWHARYFYFEHNYGPLNINSWTAYRKPLNYLWQVHSSTHKNPSIISFSMVRENANAFYEMFERENLQIFQIHEFVSLSTHLRTRCVIIIIIIIYSRRTGCCILRHVRGIMFCIRSFTIVSKKRTRQSGPMNSHVVAFDYAKGTS
jgi:hypothetical protein